MHWSESSWFYVLDGFCESKLNTQFEIGNTVSSLFIVFWGIYGLHQLPSHLYQTAIWKIIYGLLISVGVGSIAFHYTLYVGFGLMDALPMLISLFLGLIQMIEVFLRIKLNRKSITQLEYDVIAKLSNVVCILLMLFSVVYTCLSGQHDEMFPAIILTVPVLILVMCILMYFCDETIKSKIKSSPQYKLIFRHLWVGYSFAAFAAMIWNLYERSCDEFELLPYFPVHSVWHFSISYGMYIIIQVGIFLDFNNDGLNITIKTKEDGKNVFFKLWFFMVPVLYIRLDDNGSDITDNMEQKCKTNDILMKM